MGVKGLFAARIGIHNQTNQRETIFCFILFLFFNPTFLTGFYFFCSLTRQFLVCFLVRCVHVCFNCFAALLQVRGAERGVWNIGNS